MAGVCASIDCEGLKKAVRDHGNSISSPETPRSLVLTKKIAASGDENVRERGRKFSRCNRSYKKISLENLLVMAVFAANMSMRSFVQARKS